MKTITTLCCILCFAVCGVAQQAVIHENNVHPSMTEQYKTAVLKLKDVCAANKINMKWVTMVFDDNTFAHVLPQPGEASLDTDLWVELKSKIGEDAFQKLVGDIRAAVASSVYGTSAFMPEHSYFDPKPDEPYRAILCVYPLSGKEAEMENLFLDWKKAFAACKTPENFHVYKVIHGGEQAYLISLSAKDPADMEVKRSQTYQLGGDMAELWNKQLKLTKKYFWRRGYFDPRLGYAHGEAAN